MNYTRRFSLEQDFMNYSTDDLLYGMMQYLATYHTESEVLYLTKQNFNKKKKEIYALCDLNSRSLKRHLDKLKEQNLIDEIDLYCDNQSIPVYTFPYDIDDRYQLIDWEMLWYVVSTRNKFAVKVYVYLLNKFLWKQQTDEKYNFTLQELTNMLGYSGRNTTAESMLSNVLESFSREGVIGFSDYWIRHCDFLGNEKTICKKQLDFVACKKSEIKTTFSGI